MGDAERRRKEEWEIETHALSSMTVKSPNLYVFTGENLPEELFEPIGIGEETSSTVIRIDGGFSERKGGKFRLPVSSR